MKIIYNEFEMISNCTFFFFVFSRGFDVIGFMRLTSQRCSSGAADVVTVLPPSIYITKNRGLNYRISCIFRETFFAYCTFPLSSDIHWSRTNNLLVLIWFNSAIIWRNLYAAYKKRFNVKLDRNLYYVIL